MFIPKTVAGIIKRRSCVCNSEACIEITSLFAALGDIRGQYKKLPNPISDSRKGIVKAVLDKWDERCCIHLRINITKFRESICYNKRPPKRNTRSQAPVQNLKDAYVAMWHFHPNLHRQYNGQIPRSVSLQTVRSMSLFSIGGNFYSNIDIITGQKGQQEVVLVPNYLNVEIAKADYEEALRVKNGFVAAQTALCTPSPTRPRKRRNPAIDVPSINTSRARTGQRETVVEDNITSTDASNMSKDQLLIFVKSLQDSCNEKDEAIEDNKNAIVNLQNAVRAQHKVNGITDAELRSKLTESNETIVTKLAHEMKTSGLNRISMSGPELFTKHGRHCKDLYGFPDFEYMKCFIERMLGVEYIRPSKPFVTAGGRQNNGLGEFEQVLLTLLFTNTHWNYDVVGSIFGVATRQTVKKYIDKWLPLLGELGDMLSSFSDILDADAIDMLEPEWYIKLNLRKIAGLVDGKDFMCETVRTDRYLNCAQASNKVNHSAFRLLTWSLPCGAVIIRTPAFFGRASEKAILRAWGNLGMLNLPPGYFVLGDKGFDNTAGSYTNYNTTLHPAFLTNDQFSRDEVNHNIEICKKRYTCETVYARVTETSKLSGVVARESFPHFESLVGWAHGLANISFGYLQKIHDYDH